MLLISLTQMSLVNGESDLATVLHGNTLVSSSASLQAPDQCTHATSQQQTWIVYECFPDLFFNALLQQSWQGDTWISITACAWKIALLEATPEGFTLQHSQGTASRQTNQWYWWYWCKAHSRPEHPSSAQGWRQWCKWCSGSPICPHFLHHPTSVLPPALFPLIKGRLPAWLKKLPSLFNSSFKNLPLKSALFG